MDLTPRIPQGRQIVQSYGDGGFRVSGALHTGSLLVFPERVVAWPVAGIADVTEADFALVIAAEPRVDVLLVGCGRRMALLPAALRARLRAAGIVPDVMDTGAACRTYNVLMAEERRVAAALIAV